MNAFEPIREKLTRILLVTPEEKMYAEVLDLLLGVFESEFGYFGYISRDGHLVCPSMTRHIFPQCQVPDKDIVFRREIWGGLWGRILLERKSLIKNASHGVPVGHLPIARSFGSPILYREELVGQFHFANRERDYDESDIALLDIGLPVIDGYELCRRILSSGLEPRPMLVAITGYGQRGDRERARAAGFDHHMVKPVDLHALATLLGGGEP